jgi:hypothetical protein
MEPGKKAEVDTTTEVAEATHGIEQLKHYIYILADLLVREGRSVVFLTTDETSFRETLGVLLSETILEASAQGYDTSTIACTFISEAMEFAADYERVLRMKSWLGDLDLSPAEASNIRGDLEEITKIYERRRFLNASVASEKPQ